MDKKLFKNLKIEYKEIIKHLFPYVTENNLIECWVSKFHEKSDIKVRIGTAIKGISIKMGHSNSFHMEHINDFEEYLISIGFDELIIEKINHFISWKSKNTNKKSYFYKIEYKSNYLEINEALNELYIKINLFIRFIFQGNNKFKYSASILIYGTPESFLWADRSEIIEYFLNHENMRPATFKIGLLSMQSFQRNKENFIQIKWHGFEKAMIDICNIRSQKKAISQC